LTSTKDQGDDCLDDNGLGADLDDLGPITNNSDVLDLYPNSCDFWPHFDCIICWEFDDPDYLLSSPKGNLKCEGSTKEVENARGYYLYPAGAWCEGECGEPDPGNDNVIEKIDKLCDKLGLEGETLTELICRKIEAIEIPPETIVNPIGCDTSPYATEE
jgi:hypothetical protein